MSEAPKPEQPQELDWVAIAQAMATASPDVLERMRAALAEREAENPTVGVVLELDRRARAIRQALPGLSHDHAQALLAQEGTQARMAYSELAQAVADAISAVGWSKAQPHLQRIQLLMGQPWGLNVFRAGVKRADAADLDGVISNLSSLTAVLSTPRPPDGTDRAVARMVGEVRDAEGPSLDDRIAPENPDCELTWRDMDLYLEVGAYMAEHEPQVWRHGGPAYWRRAAWIYRRCQEVERDRRPGEERRGPFELLRPQPKEQPKPPRPKSLLEQLGISHGELAHRLRAWQLARTGQPEHTVALPQMVRGAPL